MRFEPTEDPAEFQRRAGAFLSRDPLPHTVIIAVLQRLLHGTGETETTFVSVHDGDTVTGVAMHTRGYDACLGTVPAAAIPGLVALFADRPVALSGVQGRTESATDFARRWTALRGIGFRQKAAMLLYRLDDLRLPRVPGSARRATAADIDLCTRWMAAMNEEVGAGYPPEAVPGRIADGLVWLWEYDGIPVSLAGEQIPVYGWSRIGPVYTPPAARGRGYGSAVTADASKRLRDSGCRVCLFTDTANPTSNKIYRDIGYVPVGDFVHYRFGAAA
ncbi:GNAT family N-acetyltransferase [Nocardia sp. BMG111209]|uniref:GNAT family N-acetyltransferase n=1 Tax=Nocardia sp. BMG111209 TaxID=1160137 RepID=UPI0012DEBC08|nr:GNAT family N-acetyltransferase [Nocardia sp. BMG111209]